MRAAVVGLGKIGLPLAAQLASKGHTVVGCDIDPEVVATVNAGRSHVLGEAGLAEAVSRGVAAGLLSATDDAARATTASEAVLVVVPLSLGLDRAPDYGPLDRAIRSVADGLRAGILVTIETTVPVGTTRGRLLPLLEEGSGLRAGRDFFLAFSPERVYSGRIFEDLRRYPKVVGGIDEESTRHAVDFYRAMLDAEILPVSNAETAEFVKLAETSYRDVNIALANELALYAGNRQIDAVEAFRAANTQPFSHLHSPSVGVGGHCIPVYPHFLLLDAGPEELQIVRQARRVNDHMAEVAVRELEEALQGLGGKTVLVLGLAYRENVKELAFTVAVPLIRLLRDRGAQVLAHDPLFTPDEIGHLAVRMADLSSPLSVDAVVIQAYHRDYEALDWRRFQGLRVVLDGRGGLDPARLAGTPAQYIRIGGARRLRGATRAGKP